MDESSTVSPRQPCKYDLEMNANCCRNSLQQFCFCMVFSHLISTSVGRLKRCGNHPQTKANQKISSEVELGSLKFVSQPLSLQSFAGLGRSRLFSP